MYQFERDPSAKAPEFKRRELSAAYSVSNNLPSLRALPRPISSPTSSTGGREVLGPTCRLLQYLWEPMEAIRHCY